MSLRVADGIPGPFTARFGPAGMLPPFGLINGVSVGPSGAVYVAGDLGNLVYKLTPRTLYLPGAANNGGLESSRWTTDLELHNRGDVQASYTVELLVRGQANPAPTAASFELAPEASVRYTNVLEELFDLEGAATLRVTSVRGEVMASARTKTDSGNGFYGQYLEAMDEATGVAGHEVRLIQLESSAAARHMAGDAAESPGSDPAYTARQGRGRPGEGSCAGSSGWCSCWSP